MTHKKRPNTRENVTTLEETKSKTWENDMDDTRPELGNLLTDEEIKGSGDNQGNETILTHPDNAEMQADFEDQFERENGYQAPGPKQMESSPQIEGLNPLGPLPVKSFQSNYSNQMSMFPANQMQQIQVNFPHSMDPMAYNPNCQLNSPTSQAYGIRPGTFVNNRAIKNPHHQISLDTRLTQNNMETQGQINRQMESFNQQNPFQYGMQQIPKSAHNIMQKNQNFGNPGMRAMNNHIKSNKMHVENRQNKNMSHLQASINKNLKDSSQKHMMTSQSKPISSSQEPLQQISLLDLGGNGCEPGFEETMAHGGPNANIKMAQARDPPSTEIIEAEAGGKMNRNGSQRRVCNNPESIQGKNCGSGIRDLGPAMNHMNMGNLQNKMSHPQMPGIGSNLGPQNGMNLNPGTMQSMLPSQNMQRLPMHHIQANHLSQLPMYHSQSHAHNLAHGHTSMHSPPFESPNRHYCLEHRVPADLVCHTDQKIICSNCALFGTHKGHNYVKFAEFKQDCRSRLQSLRSELKKTKFRRFLREGEKEADMLREKVKDKKVLLYSQMEVASAELIRRIREREAKIKADIETRFNTFHEVVDEWASVQKKMNRRAHNLEHRLSKLSGSLESRQVDFQFLLENLYEGAAGRQKTGAKSKGSVGSLGLTGSGRGEKDEVSPRKEIQGLMEEVSLHEGTAEAVIEKGLAKFEIRTEPEKMEQVLCRFGLQLLHEEEEQSVKKEDGDKDYKTMVESEVVSEICQNEEVQSVEDEAVERLRRSINFNLEKEMKQQGTLCSI